MLATHLCPIPPAMEAPPNRQTFRAPPPTPIATGKGLRSAAVDDRLLTEYLEKSLKVPDLTLPQPLLSPKSRSLTLKPTARPKITLSSILASDDVAIRAALASAAAIGAFWIDGGDFEWMEEVRSLVEVWGQRTEEELCWSSAMEEEQLTAELDGYRIFRDKLEKVRSALEFVAESIIKSLVEHVENHCTALEKAQSFLYIRKHGNTHCLRGPDAAKHHPSCALRLQISVSDNQFSVYPLDSNHFTLPAGSVLVSIGKQLEEFFNGEMKSFSGEIFVESSDDQRTPVSLELIYSLPDLNLSNHSSTKILSLMDQLLILLTVVLLYNLLS